MRPDGRRNDELRTIEIAPNYLTTAEGSALITFGNTQVLCAASVEQSVPPFLRNSGKGWVTAEYSMLPRATSTRTARRSGTSTRTRGSDRRSRSMAAPRRGNAPTVASEAIAVADAIEVAVDKVGEMRFPTRLADLVMLEDGTVCC